MATLKLDEEWCLELAKTMEELSRFQLARYRRVQRLNIPEDMKNKLWKEIVRPLFKLIAQRDQLYVIAKRELRKRDKLILQHDWSSLSIIANVADEFEKTAEAEKENT